MGDAGKPAMGTSNIVVIYRPLIRDTLEYSSELIDITCPSVWLREEWLAILSLAEW